MSELKKSLLDGVKKPCPKGVGLCCIEVFRTCEKPPKNIRIGCTMHGYTMPGSYESVEQAIEAWNRRAE